MKIAQIAPIIERIPPTKYGGTERVIHTLTEELVSLGHDVTLFASGDSQSSARLVSVVSKPLRGQQIKNLYGANSATLLNIGLAYKLQHQFDVIHDHTNDLSLPTANLATTPTVFTIHGAFNNQVKPIFETLDNVNLVSISASQRKSMPHLPYVGTVHHGIRVEEYPFSDKPSDFLLFVGRITPAKGLHIAIDIANKLNKTLIIAAKVEKYSPTDMKYFHQVIKPKLSKTIRWIGEVNSTTRNKLLSKAFCLMFPIRWEEPFGMVLIEAMACGTPVVAFNRGSVPEIVLNKKTGFVVNTPKAFMYAVAKIHKINRKDCRVHVETNFSASKMALEYLKIYLKVIQKPIREVNTTNYSLNRLANSKSQSNPKLTFTNRQVS